MDAITAIGLDIAKSVVQIHGIDAEGEAVTRRQLIRSRVLPCLCEVAAVALSH
jgi:transposase